MKLLDNLLVYVHLIKIEIFLNIIKINISLIIVLTPEYLNDRVKFFSYLF
jgi:hypothetical protein